MTATSENEGKDAEHEERARRDMMAEDLENPNVFESGPFYVHVFRDMYEATKKKEI